MQYTLNQTPPGTTSKKQERSLMITWGFYGDYLRMRTRQVYAAPPLKLRGWEEKSHLPH